MTVSYARRTALALGVFFVVGTIACSSKQLTSDADEGASSTTSEHPLCHLSTSPEALQGLVPKEDVCQCPGDSPTAIPIATASPVDTGGLATAPPTDDDKVGASINPLLHGSQGGICKTQGFCIDWAKQKLKELAACIGIACAAVGGDAPVAKVIVDAAKLVCCVKPGEVQKHQDLSDALKNLVNQQCNPKDGGK